MTIAHLDDQRLAWVAGEAHCGGCGHTWRGVIHAEADFGALECPSCHATSGQLHAACADGHGRPCLWRLVTAREIVDAISAESNWHVYRPEDPPDEAA